MNQFTSGIVLNNGKVLEAEKISELTNYIINKFADEKLTMEEAMIVLQNVGDSVRECSIVQKLTDVL